MSSDYQNIDGDKHSDNDEVLDRGTPQVTKWPDRGKGIVGRSEENALEDEQKIRKLQIQITFQIQIYNTYSNVEN